MEKKKVLKIILLIILLILVLFAIHTIRNYIILDKIVKKQAEIQNSTNYSFVIENYSENEKFIESKSEVYYKDGKCVRTIKKENEDLLFWSDNNTKEEIFVNKNLSIATIHELSSNTSDAPTFITENSVFLAMFSLILSDEINGEECYVINNICDPTYISKENGTMLKTIRMGGQDGEEFEIVTEYRNWKFDEVTDEDVARPDLSKYKVL